MNVTGISLPEKIVKVCAWWPPGSHDQDIRFALELQGWTFSHSICPSCLERLSKEIVDQVPEVPNQTFRKIMRTVTAHFVP